MLDKFVRIGMEVTYRGLKNTVTRKAGNGSYMLSIGDSFTYAFPDEFEPFPLPSTHARRTEEYNKAMAQLNEISVQVKQKETSESDKHNDKNHPTLLIPKKRPISDFVPLAEGKINETKAPKHYDNTNGSLYLFSEHHELNAYEFDALKRLIRCRRKGEFIEDIKKTIHVLELYLKEQGHLYENLKTK